MISFIIIGRNEDRNLKNCIISIYNTIFYTNLINYEIIYVDSKSTDKSLKVAKEFKDVRVFKITGCYNSAIGRNIGAKESKGEILFFIDADMEIKREFIAEVLDSDGSLKFNIVSGQVVDIIDGVEMRRFSNQSLGGIFLIRRELWQSVNGMRTKYKRGQDLDLGLRLYKKGYSLIRKSEVITYHNTIPVLDKSRIWKMLWDKSFFYPRSVLYRDHIFNKQMYQLLWQTDKTFIILFLTIVSSFIIHSLVFLFMTIYLCAILLRCFKQKGNISILELIWFYIVLDIFNLLFLFTFFPENKKINYIEI